MGLGFKVRKHAGSCAHPSDVRSGCDVALHTGNFPRGSVVDPHPPPIFAWQPPPPHFTVNPHIPLETTLYPILLSSSAPEDSILETEQDHSAERGFCCDLLHWEA